MSEKCTCGFCKESSIEKIADRLFRDTSSKAAARWVALRFAKRNEEDGHQCAATEYRAVARRLS